MKIKIYFKVLIYIYFIENIYLKLFCVNNPIDEYIFINKKK